MHWLRLKIPPPVYLLLFAVLMWLLVQYVPQFNLIPYPWNQAGLGLIALALSMDIWSLWLFFLAKTTPNPMKPKNASNLVITGLYRYSRNPMYVGLLTLLTGWAIYQTNLLGFLLLPGFIWVLNRQQIMPEEEALADRFGESYSQYKSRVRRWL